MICFIDILILMANTYGFLFYSDSKMDIEQNICVVCNVYIVKKIKITFLLPSFSFALRWWPSGEKVVISYRLVTALMNIISPSFSMIPILGN